jgi:23S rRNA pseudouridine1911/1915/1917 synthase
MIDAREKLSPVAPPLVDPADLRSWLILEDEHLLVFDKPGWLLCHPSKNGPWSSLGSAVREEFQQDIIRFVYRLDRETSGVIVLARTEAIGRRLQSAVPHRKIGKLYVTLLEGEMSEPVTVDQPLGPDPNVNVTVKQRVAAGEGSQEAISTFYPLAVRGGYTLAGVQLKTGRKHQIRAHAEWLGRRVVGDKLYGPDPGLYLEFAVHGWTARHSEQLSMTRQALHCAAIDLRPTGLDYLLRAPWPADMGRFAEQRMGLPAAEAQRLIDGFVERKLSVGEL